MTPNGCHLAGFSEDVAFARHFVASHPVGVLLIIARPVKSYLKWWEIQLAIQLFGG